MFARVVGGLLCRCLGEFFGYSAPLHRSAKLPLLAVARHSEFQSIRGMHDLLPPESERWQLLIETFRTQLGRCGYQFLATPVVEQLEVFARLGEGTDVVTKEMYTFEDRDGQALALRPESTAGAARSFIQHRPTPPWKVWYFSQHFRYERPQAGRYRQHHQLGAECFGPGDGDIDVELIVALWDFYQALGLRRIRLELNSIGEPATRARYSERLQAYLGDRVDQLDPADRVKIEEHPFRVLDSKRPQTQAALVGIPTLVEELTPDEATRFARVCDGLAAAGVPFEVNPRLVRGLDYYTHTVFEIISEAIDAAQSTIGGGGRYDGLVEALGGPATPGFGFGTGVERVLLACDAEGVFGQPAPSLTAFVVEFGGDGSEARDLCLSLRRMGFSVDRAPGKSPKSQMKAADRSGAEFAVILGSDELRDGTVTLRPLRSELEQMVIPRAELAERLRRASTIATDLV